MHPRHPSAGWAGWETCILTACPRPWWPSQSEVRCGRPSSTGCRDWCASSLDEWDLAAGRRRHVRPLLVGPARPLRRGAGDAQAGLSRRRVRARGTWRLQRWPGTARSGCCGPTRTAGRCCWSGCTRRTSTTSGTSRRARSSPASTAASTCPAPPQLRTLTSYVERLDGAAERRCRAAPRCRAGWSSRRCPSVATFVADQASTGTMIHGDLHYDNVLAGRPGALAGDRPQAGERRPALRGRAAALEPVGRAAPATSADGVRRRFHAIVDAAGLDEDRARDWVVVRMLHHALWELEARA